MLSSFLAENAIAEEDYIDLFELDPDCALYLGSHSYEEPETCANAGTSDRNEYMIDLMGVYRHFGQIPNRQEMPDYLPLMVDFLAMTVESKDDSIRHKLIDEYLLPYFPPMRSRLEALERTIFICSTQWRKSSVRNQSHSHCQNNANKRCEPMWDNFLFIGLPYIAVIMLFFGGVIYRGFSGVMGRYRGDWDLSVRGDYLWTTRSTGFFGRASIGPASLCLHWGIIILFFAHVIGLIGGAYSLASWVEFFRWAGLGGGILYGIVWALVRRIAFARVKAMSTPDDYIILLFLIVISGLGLYQSAVEMVFGLSYSVGLAGQRL